MFLKILKMIVYFFIIFAKPVYADSFEETSDAQNNQYYQTVAFASNGFPDIQDILYERRDFLAEDTNTVLNSNLSAYADFDLTRRIPNVADHIDAPPGTQVDIVYLYKNSTGHDLNIDKIGLILSRNIKENGDLTQILEISETKEGNLFYKYSGQNLLKSGIYKEYPGKGIIFANEQGADILENVNIKNPLSVEQVSLAKDLKGDILAKIFVQNTSNEYLSNLQFKYGTFEKTFNLPAYQEEIVEFTIENSQEELGSFSIYNPNIQEVCAVYGNEYYNYLGTDAISVFAYREENIVPGALVQPARESMCIKRIPYTMISEPLVFVEEDSEPEVLGVSEGIKILPKTSKVDWIFVGLLVVDGLLWYSFGILRRKYESKNINTRVRTKSSKDVGEGGV